MTLDILPSPNILPLEHRTPLTVNSFIRHLLPALLCYYVTAVLVQLPHTSRFRFALLPFSLWSTFSAATRVNAAGIFNDERLLYWNQAYILALSTLAIRDVTWTFRINPLQRLRSTRIASKDNQIKLWEVAIDACDLFFNLRGLGWDWSVGLRIPVHSRPTHLRSAFLLATVRDSLITMLIFDIFHYSIQWVSPSTIGSTHGGTIFDSSLPPVQRYIRSTSITLLGCWTVCFGIQLFYNLATIIGVLVFRQTPEQWPPAFNEPWLSTSVTKFWSCGWHQMFRDNFIRLGSIPCAFFFGRIGGVMGAFLVSGLMHFLGMWGMGSRGESVQLINYFLMMGVGTLLEYAFKKVTGRRVQGRWGWIWLFLWLFCWSNLLIEAWSTGGVFGSVLFPAHIRPSYRLFGPLT